MEEKGTRAQVVDFVVMVIVACAVITGVLYAANLYHAYPHYIQAAAAVLVLALVFRGVRGRKRLEQKGCWLQYIHETSHEGGDVDLAILYRYDDQEVTLYGRRASRERAKVILLPPVESWPQRFPLWMVDKQEFFLKTLSYYYEVEWTESALYPLQKQAEGALVENPVELRATEVASRADSGSQSSGSRWKLERDDPGDYKGRSLKYEEPGFRLAAYVEMSGVSEFSMIGTSTDLSTWTEPKDVPIDERKRRELLEELTRWCREHRLRLSLSPPVGTEEYLWNEERQGNIIVHNADGSVTIISPPRGRR